MLKKIDVADVRLGMYIHKLEGPWLKHPFWKTKFLLTDPDQLADLQASELEGVVIDIDKGDDVGSSEPARRRPLVSAHSSGSPIDRSRLEPPASPLRATMAARPFDIRSTTPVGTAREVSNAIGIAARSERILSGLFNQARLGRAIRSSQIEPVIDELFTSIQRNPHAFNGLMRVKRENGSLYTHALAVSALMIALGRHMKLSSERIRLAGMAGLLMDVGMGHLPLDVATIQDALSETEHETVKTHTKLGYDFLHIGGEIPEDVMKVCLEHHERFDGSGYPLGLAGEEISQFSRMAAICDVYDSMTSDRPHRPRLEPNEVFHQMREMEGQFDPDILGHFIESLGVYPIGSVVRLSSGRLALVIDQHAEDYTRPRVWTFYDVQERRITKPEDIDLIERAGREEIVCSDNADGYGIANFPALREMVFTSASKAMS